MELYNFKKAMGMKLTFKFPNSARESVYDFDNGFNSSCWNQKEKENENWGIKIATLSK